MSLTTFGKRNLCALVLAITVFGLTIASASATWYFTSDTYTSVTQTSSSISPSATSGKESELNYTRVYYDLSGARTEAKSGPTARPDSIFKGYEGKEGNRVIDVFRTAQAFTLIALITAFILGLFLFLFFFDRIRNKIIFAFGMTLTRVFVIVLCLLVTASVIVAFLSFLGLTQAFDRELSACAEGLCRKFADRIETVTYPSASVTVTRVQAWGPHAGWYLDLAAIVVSLPLLIVVVMNKFPLPIDSEASSGEAL